MSERLTMMRLAEMVPDEAAAYRYMERLRWNGTPMCPHCHSTEVTYLNPENGTSRKTRTGAASQRRVWQCRDCRKQFSVLTGTVMHGTRISIRIWLFVIFEMVANKNGVAEAEIARRYGLCNRTAWHLLHRIREAMGNGGLSEMMGGEGHVVVADETFIGGSFKSMNNATRKRAEAPQPIVPGVNNGGYKANKTAVLTLIDTNTGEARSRVVNDVTGATLRKAIAEQVDMAATTLHSDEGRGYLTFSHEWAAHETVNHKDGQYARYRNGRTITSNQAENFFSQLKRSLDGTHHHVSRKHLHRYLGEFDFRYSTRKATDTDRMAMLISQMDGIRLAYRPLAA